MKSKAKVQRKQEKETCHHAVGIVTEDQQG
jgi:hypothetical protein